MFIFNFSPCFLNTPNTFKTYFYIHQPIFMEKDIKMFFPFLMSFIRSMFVKVYCEE